MPSPRRLIILLACLLAGALAPAALATAGPHLHASVTATGTPATVQLTIANTGDAAGQLPTWLTGAHGIVDPILEVSHDGVAAPYMGMLAKHREPTAADMVAVPAGGSVSWTVDVGTAYALHGPGTYVVRYRVVLPDGAVVESAQVGVPVAAATPAARPSAASRLGELAVTYNGCTDSERAQLTTALAAADDYARNAVAAFAAGRQGTRYVMWFGTYLAARWNTVQAHFTAIQGVTGGTIAGFDCTNTGCSAGVYAYVYPGTPYVIHPCGQFWLSPVTGTDSRAGTLIHEISHFTVVAGTVDHVYGQAGAMNLAATAPAQAVSNADNHEYFAENDPPHEYVAYTASRSSIDFGTVASGSTTAASITLTSSGDLPLHVTSILAPTNFTITATSCLAGPLPPAATCTIALAYSPVADGTSTGTLSVSTDADPVPTAITLAGTAVTVPPDSSPAPTPADVTPGAPAPVAAAPATEVASPIAPAARLASTAACAGSSCGVRGTLPTGASRVTVSAVRKGTPRTARGTCKVTRRAGRATYTCGITLAKGTWAVTTRALGASGEVATSTVSKTVR